jgi:GT2 family glycosyltransferase
MDTVPAAVSVVIVNHNAGAVLRDCLSTALAEARQVILVDNASVAKTFDRLIARFAMHPRLTVIRSAENVGFAAGCNIGLAQASEPAVLFLNPDSVPAEGAIRAMLDTLEADGEAGMVGGLLLSVDGSEQGGGRRAIPTPWRSFVRAFGLSRFARRWPTLFDDFHLHMQPLPAEPIAVEAISGACMMISRTALEAVGPMDDGYFLHCEDLDYCMRIRAAGMRIIFNPHAAVTHVKGGCSRDRQLFVEWHKHKGMLRFYRKHFRHRYPTALMAVVRCGVWARFAAVSMPHLVPSARRWLAARQWSLRPFAEAAPGPARSAGMLAAERSVSS